MAKAGAFTERRALPPLERRSPVRVATASSFASPTSGLSSTGESVAGSERFRPVRPDAPMGFGSTRSDVCRARSADQPVRAVVPPRRFQPVAASATTREWRGRQDLGLSGTERPDAGSHPEEWRPAGPARWQPEDCYASGPPGRPEGRTRIGRIGVGRPEGRPRPRLARIPKDPVLTLGEIPREFPSAGPFHPKVLGLRLHRAQTPKSRSRPSAQPRRAGTGVRAWTGGLIRRRPKAPANGARKHALRRFAPHRPKAVRTSTCHGQPTLLGWTLSPRSAPSEEAALRGEPSPPEGGEAAHGSGPSPASWRWPASGQTDIVSNERAGLGLKDPKSPHDPKVDGPAQAPGARLVPRSHPRRDSSSHVTEVAWAGADRSPPRARRAVLLARRAFAPVAPKRPESLDQQAGQAMESNMSMFTSKNVSEDPFSSR